MNSLRSSQLSAMLFLSAAFTILCQTASWTMEGIFGTGIAVAVQFLLCVPIFLLYRQGFSLSDGDVKHRLLSTLLLGYLLVRGGVSFVRLQRASDALTLPVSGKFFAAALIALVCIYTASLGIRALARSSTLILGLLLFALAVLLLGAVPQAEPQNLSLSTDDTIFRGFLREMACASSCCSSTKWRTGGFGARCSFWRESWGSSPFWRCLAWRCWAIAWRIRRCPFSPPSPFPSRSAPSVPMPSIW